MYLKGDIIELLYPFLPHILPDSSPKNKSIMKKLVIVTSELNHVGGHLSSTT
jgi:hypothetical protein